LSRYETLLENVLQGVTAEMTPEDLEALAEPLEQLNQKEATIAAAYKLCSCGAAYTEAQWANMAPVPGRKWALDAFVVEEWRECPICHIAMVVFERNGRRLPSDSMPIKAIAKSHECCGTCLLPIKPGQIYVERWERKNRMKALGRWAFCSIKCEAW
jgi:hypothetical protein